MKHCTIRASNFLPLKYINQEKKVKMLQHQNFYVIDTINVNIFSFKIGMVVYPCCTLKFYYLSFQYYAECHAVIYIVDSSDRDRVSESKETFGEI